MEPPERSIRPMTHTRKPTLVLCAALLIGSSLAATTAKAAQRTTPSSPTPAQYHRTATAAGQAYAFAVTRICAGALLFEQAHATGTHADALATASDIRASTQRRLALVAAIPAPSELRGTIDRWLSLQRRLAASYARNWVRIYDTIDAARTPSQHAELAQRLEKLVQAPDPLRRDAGRLELELNLPDCTGG